MEEQNIPVSNQPIQQMPFANPNMIPCPSCGTPMAKNAKACPKCGAKNKKPIYKKAWFYVLIVLVLIVAISVGASGGEEGGSTDSGSGNSSSQQSAKPAGQKKYVPGDTLDANGLKVTYVSAEKWTGYDEMFAPDDGYKLIRLYFKFENTSSSDRLVSRIEFDCYADGSITKDYFFTGEKGLQSTTLSSGRKAEGYIYFQVPKDAEEIEVEYETNFWTDKKAIFKVEL